MSPTRLLFLAVALLASRTRTATATASASASASASAEEPAKWDVNAPYGPTTRLDFEVDEGTWINLDVSPDGKDLVFDLLGDLYLMPVDGTGSGFARRLTSGAAFDMQPRFSPDGSLIAFASDRDGATNLWVIRPDGSGLRQVSKEKSWFINSPVWSPDGQYLFARHHFVKQRSLGAGEIWMYHVGGSTGLQVTEKVSFQKDEGEPTLSPDGRYLYYSKDVSGGDAFEYNKDPNGAIYAVMRRDLLTGEERAEVQIQGGATAPRVSPDGSRLAFIRRVRLGSVLYLHDLATGENRPLFDKLDKDLQEAWAIHGLYPDYAFTPDGSALFVWGQGKIWRVDTASGHGVEVPFRARIEQVIQNAVRFPQKVFEDTFPVRMLRHVTPAPDGASVVYSALGRLYRKPLPAGEARRLTRDDRIEHSPCFSSDGRFVAYATWSDEDKGRIRIMKADGTDSRDLVEAPGHYTEPSFSPDGTLVVYRRAEGDQVRGGDFGTDPGIYVVPVDGREPPRRVHERGVSPRFSADGRRVSVVERRGDKTVLVSFPLRPAPGDAGEVVRLESDNAVEIVPSPDDAYVAFVERFKVFVAPLPRSGRAVAIGPASTAVPVAQVWGEGGDYLHWSGDGRTLYWSVGPELFSVALDDVFDFRGEETVRKPTPRRVAIGFQTASDVPDGSVAFVGGRIITVARGRDPVIENGTVVVERNRITAVGPSSDVRIPPGAFRVDASGRTLMPGIVDVHAHVGSENDGILAEQSWPLVANLAYGVTTSHDPSNDTEMVFTNAEMIRAGEKLGPRLYSTGTVLYGAETPFKAVIETYDDALGHLRRLKAAGAFTVKSYNQQRRDARQMIIKAARELQMMVVPEGGSLLYMDETFVIDGHTGLEHSLPVPNLYSDVVNLFAKSETGYTPTLIVGYGGLMGEYYWYQHTNVWENENLLQFTPREIVDSRSRRRTMAEEGDFNHILISKGAKKILDAGGHVQLGAHGQLQGLGAHWELWMLAQGGMTPLEAIRAATLDGARYIGLDGDIGSIEAGKLADIVVLAKNPLEDIRNSESVVEVMKNGRLYEAATTNEIGNRRVRRPPFYWQPPTERGLSGSAGDGPRGADRFR
jgi:imidazolonepropionase-like amidohydrolase/Tol biopolymer transport system component